MTLQYLYKSPLCQIIFVNYIRWLDANEPRNLFVFLVHNHKKDPCSVVVSHGVKFSTSTMIDLTAVFNTTLVLVGRRDLAVFV